MENSWPTLFSGHWSRMNMISCPCRHHLMLCFFWQQSSIVFLVCSDSDSRSDLFLLSQNFPFSWTNRWTQLSFFLSSIFTLFYFITAIIVSILCILALKLDCNFGMLKFMVDRKTKIITNYTSFAEEISDSNTTVSEKTKPLLQSFAGQLQILWTAIFVDNFLCYFASSSGLKKHLILFLLCGIFTHSFAVFLWTDEKYFTLYSILLQMQKYGDRKSVV